MTTGEQFLIPEEFQSQDSERVREEKADANLEFISLRMVEVLRGESRGGNADHVVINGKPLICAAVNFYHDNGVIHEMGNIQNLSSVVQALDKGTIKIGVSINKDERSQSEGASVFMVEVYLSGENNSDFVESKEVLELTKLKYNIDRSNSVEDLFTSLDLHKGKLYDSEKRELSADDYVKPAIIKIVQGEMDPRFITSNYGLRKKVVELIEKFKNNK